MTQYEIIDSNISGGVKKKKKEKEKGCSKTVNMQTSVSACTL